MEQHLDLSGYKFSPMFPLWLFILLLLFVCFALYRIVIKEEEATTGTNYLK